MSQASRARWRGKKGSVGRLREAAGEIEIHDAPLGGISGAHTTDSIASLHDFAFNIALIVCTRSD